MTHPWRMFYQDDGYKQVFIFDCIRKSDGIKLALPVLGWEWVRGPQGGAYVTFDRIMAQITAARCGITIQDSPVCKTPFVPDPSYGWAQTATVEDILDYLSDRMV